MEESYTSMEIQSVYFIVLADKAISVGGIVAKVLDWGHDVCEFKL